MELVQETPRRLHMPWKQSSFQPTRTDCGLFLVRLGEGQWETIGCRCLGKVWVNGMGGADDDGGWMAPFSFFSSPSLQFFFLALAPGRPLPLAAVASQAEHPGRASSSSPSAVTGPAGQ